LILILQYAYLVHWVDNALGGWEWDLDFSLDFRDLFWLVDVHESVFHDLVPVHALGVHVHVDVLLDDFHTEHFLDELIVVDWHGLVDVGGWEHLVDP